VPSSFEREHFTMIDIKNILLPTDFSEPSLAATRYGIELAKRFGATLHLLYVIEDPVVYLPMFESYPQPSKNEFEEFAQTRLDNWIADDAEGLSIERRWVHGSPFLEVIQDAKQNAIDLIVIGTHGRGIVSHVLLGSVAEKVVRKAPCPVLTVRTEEHYFVHPTAGE
jgi:nucleotide-binding universal stress UspA family protein